MALYDRYMEAFAGFLSHTDAELGRLELLGACLAEMKQVVLLDFFNRVMLGQDRRFFHRG